MADASLEILIQIREELAGLTRTRQALGETKHEAESFGELIRDGLGIGTGMEIARDGFMLLKETLHETVIEAFNFAAATKHQSEALGITSAAYQVLQLKFHDAGVDVGHLTLAITSQTRSLALARDPASAAAAAYRELGLSAAQLELLPVEERLIAVARAVGQSTDQIGALTAASQILGSRGLLPMLKVLQDMGVEGIPALTKFYEAEGMIASDDTLDRLAEAKRKWEDLFHSIVIGSADAMTWLGHFVDSVKKDPMTYSWLVAMVMGGGPGTPFGSWAATKLALMMEKNSPTLPQKTTATPGAGLAPTAGAGSAAGDDTKKYLQLQDEIHREQESMMPLEERRAALAADLAKAGKEYADLQKSGKASGEELASAELAQLKAKKELATVDDQIAQKWQQSFTAAAEIHKIAESMLPLDRQRADAAVDLANAEVRVAAVRGDPMATYEAVVAATKEEVEAKKHLLDLDKRIAAENAKNTHLEYRYPEGMAGGAKSFFEHMGTLSQQTGQIVEQSLGQAIHGLSSDIWDASIGTKSWSAAFTDLGAVAGRMLEEIIVRMLVVQAIGAALGMFGYSLNAGATGYSFAPVASTAVPATGALFGGGGTFLTKGPTNITVGDNPGGVELVNVTPISGIGQSTVNGQALAMAGGGAQMAMGGLKSPSGSGDVIMYQTLNFAGGVSQQDLLNAVPHIVAASKAAVLDAQRRKRDGFA